MTKLVDCLDMVQYCIADEGPPTREVPCRVGFTVLSYSVSSGPLIACEKCTVQRSSIMTLYSQARLLLMVSRPLTWIIAPTIWFSGLIHSGINAQDAPGILFAVALSFPTCLNKTLLSMHLALTSPTGSEVTFGVNDINDYDSDLRNRRKNNRWADGTVLDRANHRFVLLAARVSTAVVGMLVLPASTRSPQLFGYTVTFLCLVWIYSSPPFRLKNRPILDSISNGLICWLFWACGYTFKGDTASMYHGLWAARCGWYVFLLGSALHSHAAILDAHVDASVECRTIATGLGSRCAALFSMTCL